MMSNMYTTGQMRESNTSNVILKHFLLHGERNMCINLDDKSWLDACSKCV